MTNCNNCNQPIFFKDSMKSKTGKHIPLNSNDTAHDCLHKYDSTNGNGNGNKPQNETNFSVSEELDKLHKEAVFACKKYLGSEFDKMTEDKKIISVMHYENVLVQLRKK